tara:strand:- start:2266 stop:3018 length:753 start_codon:yes stop_codon:yes gene_type:complete
MKSNTNYVDKVYKLTRDAAPLSFMLPTRNTKRFPLLYFDEELGINKPLRYSRNQKTPFEDEQDGSAIIEPIIFEDGFLSVPRNNPVLQEFLHYHPMNGIRFVEVDEEKDAQDELDSINQELDALAEARALSIEQLEVMTRVLFGKDPSRLTTAELKRDILIFAKREPHAFMNSLTDPNLKLSSNVQTFFDDKLLAFRNNNKDVYFNLPSNKKRMLTIPFGEDPMHVVSSYLQSDDGIEILKMLENQLEID